MSDRIKGFTVALSEDLKEEDCQGIINAIMMIKGVVAVNTNVLNVDDYLARQRVKYELRDALYDLFKKI